RPTWRGRDSRRAQQSCRFASWRSWNSAWSDPWFQLGASRFPVQNGVAFQALRPHSGQQARKALLNRLLLAGSGRFYGGYPPERVIQQRRYPGNNGDVGQVKHIPVKGIFADPDVEQGKIDHRAIDQTADAVSDRPANDQ